MARGPSQGRGERDRGCRKRAAARVAPSCRSKPGERGAEGCPPSWRVLAELGKLSSEPVPTLPTAPEGDLQSGPCEAGLALAPLCLQSSQNARLRLPCHLVSPLGSAFLGFLQRSSTSFLTRQSRELHECPPGASHAPTPPPAQGTLSGLCCPCRGQARADRRGAVGTRALSTPPSCIPTPGHPELLPAWEQQTQPKTTAQDHQHRPRQMPHAVISSPRCMNPLRGTWCQ